MRRTRGNPVATQADAVAGPVVDVSREGASVAASDNSTALQAAMDKAWSLGWPLFIPAGTWRTQKGIVHRPGVETFGSGPGRTIVRNESPTSAFGQAVTWHFGTYGPAVSLSSTWRETGYAVQDVQAGSTLLTFVTPGNSANFTVGDLVGYEGGTDVVNFTNLPNGIARVNAVSAGTVRIDVPLPVDLVTGSAVPVLRRLNTGTVPSVASAVGDGQGATLLSGARLRDLTLEAATPGYPPLNLSCYNCTVQDVETIGWTSLSGNPVARSTFLRVTGWFSNGALEFAYQAHDSHVEECVFTRRGTDPQPSASVGIWVNSDEGARDIHFRNVTIVEATSQTFTSLHPTLQLAQGCSWRGGRVHADRQGASGIWAYGDGILIEDAVVTMSRVDGVQLGGLRTTLRGSQILGTSFGGRAVLASPSADEVVITGNILGADNARTALDAVTDLGARSQISGNRSYYTKDPVQVVTPSATSGVQPEYDLAAISWPAGAIDLGQGFEFVVTGTSTGPGAKLVRLRIGTAGVTLVSVSTGNTQWSVEGVFYVALGPDQWTYRATSIGGSPSALTGRLSQNYLSATRVAVTGETSDAGDSLNVDLRVLRPARSFGGIS